MFKPDIDTLHSLPFPFHVKDESYEWVYWNNAFLDLLGVKDLTHKNESDIFQAWQIEIFREQDERALLGHSTTRLEPVGDENFALTHKFRIQQNGHNYIGGITLSYGRDANDIGLFSKYTPKDSFWDLNQK